jgi:hypothetical protein
MTVKDYLSIDRRPNARYGRGLRSECARLQGDHDHFRSNGLGTANERHIRRHRPSSCSERDGMCRMPCRRSVVVPPAALRQVRPHWLLRYVAETALDCALPRDRPLHHHEFRARRGLVLELPHGKTVLWPEAGAPAVAASGSACPWTNGACSRELGRLPQRISNRFATRHARNEYEVHGRRN